MRYLICPDSFKGSLTAAEAAEAMWQGVAEADPEAEVIVMPMAAAKVRRGFWLRLLADAASGVRCAPPIDAKSKPRIIW